MEILKNSISIVLLKSISLKRNLDPKIVIKTMAANVITVKQLSNITGRDVNTIGNLVRLNRKSKYEGLTGVYPFEVDQDDKGPMFILVDEKCIEYIKTSLE